MTLEELNKIIDILQEAKTPMWFNSNYPILCIVPSKLNEAIDKIRKELVK